MYISQKVLEIDQNLAGLHWNMMIPIKFQIFQLIFTSMQSSAVYKLILSSFLLLLLLLLLRDIVESSTIVNREVLENWLLRPLRSEVRSEVTSEATGSLRGHF